MLLAARPVRWVWAAALVAACAAPAVATLGSRGGGAPADAAAARAAMEWIVRHARAGNPPNGTTAPPRVPAMLAAGASAARALAPLDRPLGVAWAAWSILALARLARRARRTRRAVAAALAAPGGRLRRVGRARLLVTESLGPAALGRMSLGAAPLGAWGGAVVLPAWAVADARRRLVLAHEAEHVRAADPVLLTLASVCAALVPWNPVARHLVARLHTAVELDCDRRVLARHSPRGTSGRATAAPTTVAQYGTLLLDVAARERTNVSGSTRLAPALAAPGPITLEQRIRVMTARPTPHAPSRTAALLLGAAAITALACELPRPTAPRGGSAAPLDAIASGNLAASHGPVTDPTLGQVRSALGADALNAMRAPTGRTRAIFIVDSVGSAPRTVSIGDQGARVPALSSIRPDGLMTVAVRKFAPGTLSGDSATVAWLTIDPTRGPSRTTPLADVVAPRGGAAGPTRASMDSVLVVVDGRTVGRGQAAVRTVAPDHIATVDVLRGTPAEVRFGAEGRNGVVVITTKAAAPAP